MFGYQEALPSPPKGHGHLSLPNAWRNIHHYLFEYKNQLFNVKNKNIVHESKINKKKKLCERMKTPLDECLFIIIIIILRAKISLYYILKVKDINTFSQQFYFLINNFIFFYLGDILVILLL